MSHTYERGGNRATYIWDAFDANWLVPFGVNVNGVPEAVFKVGICLPAGPYVLDDDVRYIVKTIMAAIV